MGGVEDDRRLVLRDYQQGQEPGDFDDAIEALSAYSYEDLLDLKAVVAVLHLPPELSELDSILQPRGFRLLSKIPRLPEPVVDHLVERFGTLQKLMRATIDDLDDVEGVGDTRARAIKEGLSRLAETSILDRYS